MTHPLDNPFLEWLGVELTCWRTDFAEMRLARKPDLLNRTLRIHGGVLCTLLDAAAGYAVLRTDSGSDAAQSLTISLTTQFLSAGDGPELFARGWVEQRGRSIVFARSEIRQHDRVVATAQGCYKYLAPQRARNAADVPPCGTPRDAGGQGLWR